jgi:DNA-directed RNA polymerase subunit F
MELEEIGNFDYNEKESSPMFLKEVLEICEKRKFYLYHFDEYFPGKIGGQNFIIEKTIEYAKRFSKIEQKDSKKIRNFLEEFIIKKKKKNSLELRIYLCKIIDLLPKSVSFFIHDLVNKKKFYN